MQTIQSVNTQKSGSFEIKGLSYSYRGFEVFRDFNLSASSNTIILRGPSGCGKTTLLKLLSGNLTPNSCLFMPESKGSCLVLQEDSLFPWLTGEENIAKFTKIQASQFRLHPMFYLIEPFVKQKACRMSYGQRRLVELFRAVLYKPSLLLLDEPFNFLDENNIEFVTPFLQSSFLKDTTLVLSNHHQDSFNLLASATVFKFSAGTFPVSSIERIS